MALLKELRDKLNQAERQIDDLWKVDSKVNTDLQKREVADELISIVLNIPYTHNKYQQYYSELSKCKIVLESVKYKIFIEKKEFYSCQAQGKEYHKKPFKIKLQTYTEVKDYIASDSDYRLADDLHKEYDRVLSKLQEIMRQITNRGHHAKAAIDFHKFLNGV